MGLWSRYAKHKAKQWEAKSPEERAAITEKMNARRAANDARIAAATASIDAEWERSRAEHQARLDAEVLGGPAGVHFHGTVPDTPRPSEMLRNPPSVGQDVRNSLRGLAETASDLANPKGLLGIGSEFGPDLAPEQRRQVEYRERAARDAARLRYVAAGRVPVTITRIATRGKSQFDDVARHLGESGLAGRPDLVFGVYRVPDRLDPKHPGSEDGRVVEWDVVHAVTSPLPPASPPARVRFDGEARWVSRRRGEPTVLDEDLVMAWMARAGLGPDRCLGIAREVVMQGSEGWFGLSDTNDPHADLYARVLGVTAFHAAGATHPPHAPIDVPFDGVAGTHVEVLNWAAVARAVHPRPQRAPELPSPFAYLPSTPQELLTAYLDVVGVHPADSYGAAVTIDRFGECGEVRTIREDQLSLASLKWTDATELPCADGRSRRRLHGATRVVIGYRDRPEYVDGRARWDAYQRDVLFARLELKTEARRTIGDEYDDLGVAGGVLRQVDRLSNAVDRVTSLSFRDPAHVRFRNQARYCEPLG